MTKKSTTSKRRKPKEESLMKATRIRKGMFLRFGKGHEQREREVVDIDKRPGLTPETSFRIIKVRGLDFGLHFRDTEKVRVAKDPVFEA